nr:MAG TPA: hypothetical protein [Caudoviricetes sp.]
MPCVFNVGYFFFAPGIPGLFPVVVIINVSSGFKFLIEVVFPEPDSPQIQIISAIL